MRIRVYTRERQVLTLGPGVRFGLWVQGCKRSCPGCVTPRSRPLDQGTDIEVGALAWEIILSGADGLTISGGEPFLQAEALVELIDKVHAQRDLGVIVYTGFTFEELLRDEQSVRLLERCDLLIDGPYMEELNDGRGLRGSSNQRILPLSDKYAHLVDELATCERAREAHVHADGVSVVGIPRIDRVSTDGGHNRVHDASGLQLL